ncbi:MAG TPA: 3-oxoacyl-[acyl-carrier-protein] reductase [bacterium]|nr:3-oxoacyl-[acyl-carrier-protein] reductase [Chlamydiota bacterium]HOE27820.1 3-oxoacyl-[acyl-carrier-protein] reductase [bacterium]HQM53276.1 3-oxoacyl-[acyl-carrier-protein] reductase [bacterium]
MLEGKAALVTGGAQGIGREIALRFAREGADLALLDRDADALEKTRLDAEALGRRAVALAVDISRSDETQAAVNKIVDSMKRIDILVNNAGITRDTFILRMAEADWDAVIAVNLKGAFNVTRAVARTMLRQRAGRIINIASIIGLIGNAGQANYAASKAGLIGFTKSVAKELASRGITVNAVAPGFIETRMTGVLPDEIKGRMQAMIPLGRFGAPADVAGAALFLASDLASYITGQTIVVDGGMVM